MWFGVVSYYCYFDGNWEKERLKVIEWKVFGSVYWN